MAKGKKNTVRMQSAESAYFYVATKNPRATEKLKLKGYDPELRKHVLFEEKKMPPHNKK